MTIDEHLAMALKAWSAARTQGAQLGSDYHDSQRDCWGDMASLLTDQRCATRHCMVARIPRAKARSIASAD